MCEKFQESGSRIRRSERGKRTRQNWSDCKERGNGKGEKENAKRGIGMREGETDEMGGLIA